MTDSALIDKTRKTVIHYLKGSQGVANRRNIYNAVNKESGKRVPPTILAGALQALLDDGTITSEPGTRRYEIIYRTTRAVPIWREARKGGQRPCAIATLDDLILRHVSKSGECNYTHLAASVAFRAKAPELNAKLNEMATAGLIIVTPNVKRGKGRPATIVSTGPLAAVVETAAPVAPIVTPTAPAPRPTPKKDVTEHAIRLAIGELGGRATVAEIVTETKSDEEDVVAILTALINAGTVRMLAISGSTYYRVHRAGGGK